MYQEYYQPMLATSITTVARHNNGMLEECNWPLYEVNDESRQVSYTTSSVAAYLVKNVKQQSLCSLRPKKWWHGIRQWLIMGAMSTGSTIGSGSNKEVGIHEVGYKKSIGGYSAIRGLPSSYGIIRETGSS